MLDYAISIAQIIMIDIVLSGDNAVVIALAAHKLPAHQRHQAILWGGGIAIFMRVVFTLIMAFLLMVPGVRLIGGLVLLWIACKLLVEEEEHDVTPDNADQSALAAIKMIFIADFMMSLDNMLAVAGASHGDSMRLLLGLFVSIGIIMTCSGLIARLMNRFPWIVWLGTAILALTAAEMIMGDREVARFVVRNTGISLNKHWEHDYMTTSAELPKFDGISKLPEELHELTHFSDGHLHYIGQMTADHRDELLSVAAGDQERKAVEQIFELSHERAAPGWLPSVFSSLIQPKFPAELMQKVQGRQYHWVAYVFNVAVVVICMSTPFWLRRSASPEHLAGEPPADSQSS
ncbi:MAG: TerC family protein [Planctomycetaceae bacterium]|nr:MAG: TerC family protein [Planctomycetaceae bacterium]